MSLILLESPVKAINSFMNNKLPSDNPNGQWDSRKCLILGYAVASHFRNYSEARMVDDPDLRIVALIQLSNGQLRQVEVHHLLIVEEK